MDTTGNTPGIVNVYAQRYPIVLEGTFQQQHEFGHKLMLEQTISIVCHFVIAGD